jgi:hypothetical protein
VTCARTLAWLDYSHRWHDQRDRVPDDDLAMLELRATGHTLAETARVLGVSTSSVFARCRRLGMQLADHAQFRLGRGRRHEARGRGGQAPR